MKVRTKSPAALNVTCPFTRADARAAGVSIKSLRSAIYQRLFYDLYVSSDVAVTAEMRARAALHIAGPEAYASHFTAAQIWGIPVPRDSDTHVTVTRHGDRCVRQGIKSHLRNSGSMTTVRMGIPLSTPEQTFLDLAAAGTSLIDLVIVGDMMLTASLTTIEGLIEAADEWTGSHGRIASRAARLVREGVDSPMETRMRLLVVLAGLPEPRVNLIVRAEDGSWRLRFDLCYEEYKVIVEYDGRQHADSREQWERDIYRREELERMGYRMVIVTATGIYREPLRTLERVRDALSASGATGIRSRFKNDWRRHFVID